MEISNGSKILPEKKRLEELDVLRGIAALTVVWYHFTFGFDFAYNGLSDNKSYFLYGYLGVHLFFIISGFVIFMTLERSKTVLDFIVSRISRLYPAYWVAIILTILMCAFFPALTHNKPLTIKQVLVNLTMLQHFFRITDVDGPYWTLAVELVFYFLMTMVFVFKKLNQVQIICSCWLLLSLAAALFNLPFEKYLNEMFILFHAPLFIAGINFYLLRKNISRSKNLFAHILIVTSFFIAAYIARTDKIMGETWIIELVILLIYGVFYLFAFDKLSFLKIKILVFFGTISYSLYLVHVNIGFAAITFLRQYTDNQFVYILIPLVICIFLSWMMVKFVEKPSLKYLRNLYAKNRNAKKQLIAGAVSNA
ncbi:MAG: acyltransferase [Bacteroidota bacterium]